MQIKKAKVKNFGYTAVVILLILFWFFLLNREQKLIEVSKIDNYESTYMIDEKVIAKTNAKDNLLIISVRDSYYYVDRDRLLDILSKYHIKRTWTKLYPYSRDDVEVSIDLIENNKSKFILLGKFYISYAPDKMVWSVINGEKLKEEILMLEMKKVQ